MRSLDFDEIAMIMACLTESEALRICTLSKPIYTLTHPRILEEGPELCPPDTLMKFVDFVLADPSKRLQLVRKLSFDPFTRRPAPMHGIPGETG